MDLNTLGWGEFFAQHFAQLAGDGLVPARVIREQREVYTIAVKNGEFAAEISGKLRHVATSRADFPTVGDWVTVAMREDEKKATIHAVLPRKSSFSRKAVLAGGKKDSGGKTDEQVLAANIDTVFLVCGLDNDFNVRRIERYLTVAWDSGASPVVILNKMDLCDDLVSHIQQVEAVAIGVPIHLVSAKSNEGIEALHEYLQPGKSVVFLGSSGVGKTTLINALLGEERLKVRAVREDDSRGRHTTTSRELMLLPSGGIVIDTPGLRGLEVWGDLESLQRAFSDIDELAADCRFRDCRHEAEPGCAIRAALADGTLDEKRFGNYQRLQKELTYLALRREKGGLRQAEREWDKKVRRHFEDAKKLRRRGLI